MKQNNTVRTFKRSLTITSFAATCLYLVTLNTLADSKTVNITANVPPEPPPLAAIEKYSDFPDSVHFTYDRGTEAFDEITRTVTTHDSYTVTLQQNDGLTHASSGTTLHPVISINGTQLTLNTAQDIDGSSGPSTVLFGIEKDWGVGHPDVGDYNGTMTVLFEEKS
ncbi:hypothetical protein ACWJJH_06305 [Endozoicomonadaceae bacterium StTr2]